MSLSWRVMQTATTSSLVNMALAGNTTVAVGLTGSDFSTDDEHTWQLFDQTDLRGINCNNPSCWAVGKNGIAAELMR
jgi:hypothetical protein